MPQFYAPEILKTSMLPEDEARHVQVLRMSVGDEIEILDGRGGCHRANIVKVDKKGYEVRITNSQQQSQRAEAYIHLAIAPTKNLDRMEWLIEKCVEVGIDEISFLQTRYSERKDIRLDRLEKIAISAMKQSGGRFLPKLNPLAKFDTWILAAVAQQKFIGYVSENERVELLKAAKRQSSSIILIGPEGDFSAEEINLAIANGYTPVSLGATRLRTETAGMVATVILNQVNQ